MCPIMEMGFLVRCRTDPTDTERMAWRNLEGVVQSERRAPRPASPWRRLWRMPFILDKTDCLWFSLSWLGNLCFWGTQSSDPFVSYSCCSLSSRTQEALSQRTWSSFCRSKSGIKINILKDFPGGPVAKTLCSQCRGTGFQPWSGK